MVPQLYSLRVSLKSILTSLHPSLFLLRVPEVLGLKVSNNGYGTKSNKLISLKARFSFLDLKIWWDPQTIC